MPSRLLAPAACLTLLASLPFTALAADRDPPPAAAPAPSARASAAPQPLPSPSPSAAAPEPSAAPPASASASAQVVAPWLAIPMIHRRAVEELRALVQALDKPSRDKLVGVYVAFDATMTDLGAMAACDDDGDYVVVLTDGLVALLDNAAQAQASDEAFQTRKLDAYAAFLAKSQRPNARLLPPPAGFFDGTETTNAKKVELQTARLRDGLSGLIAHELAHMASGAVVCRRPTATRESGDDAWTASEQKSAAEMAAKIYTTPRVLAADTAATTLMLDAGRSVDGLMSVLAVMDRLERGGREGLAPSYLRNHPGTAARMQWVEAAANNWRQVHGAHR